MTKGKTRAATAAKLKAKQNQQETLPRPKRLDFSTPSGSGAASTTAKKKTPKSASKNASTSSASLPSKRNEPLAEVSSSAPTTMATARVPFPPFKTDDIESWFRRVEHWFAYGKVTTEADKFALIASQIENATVANLDEMLNPHADTPYTHLKKKIISIFEATTTAKINKLLSGCQLGDMKPSQLLAEMKRMGGNVGDDIMRNLWAKRLPIHVQSVVAAATKSSLQEVSIIADAVIDVVSTPASVNQMSNNNNQQVTYPASNEPKSSEIDDLRAAVNQLTKSFRDLQSDHSRSRSKYRDSQKNREAKSPSKAYEDRVCRNHRKFGAKAFLCTKPCNFVTDGESKN